MSVSVCSVCLCLCLSLSLFQRAISCWLNVRRKTKWKPSEKPRCVHSHRQAPTCTPAHARTKTNSQSNTHTYTHTHTRTHGRRPGAEFGGTQKKFCGLFRKKFPFSRRKILMTFFSHWPGFSDLTLSFYILCVFILSNVIYDAFFTTKSHLSTKKFLDNTYFLLCSSFLAHPTTLLLKILGGPMHGPSLHLKFGGDRPPVPLGLRPWPSPAV